MKLRDLSELAARNLREALLRNSLTTLGIAVGVASLVALLSLGVGLQQLASTRLSKTGLFDAIFVMSRANQRAFGGRRQPEEASSEPARRLDDDARQQLAKIKNVVEVYPEVRFPTEIQFDGKPYPTVVAGIPTSARADGSFDGMKGSFFSGPDADEAILQIELAKDLSKTPDSLIGKEITLRYAERESLPAEAAPATCSLACNDGQIRCEGVRLRRRRVFSGFSIIPRELKLRIIGIVETEPAAGFGGIGRGRLLIPQQIAQKLRIAQPTDLREMLRGSDAKPAYESLTVRVTSPKAVQGVEDAIKQMGFGTFSILDATKNLQLFLLYSTRYLRSSAAWRSRFPPWELSIRW